VLNYNKKVSYGLHIGRLDFHHSHRFCILLDIIDKMGAKALINSRPKDESCSKGARRCRVCGKFSSFLAELRFLLPNSYVSYILCDL